MGLTERLVGRDPVLETVERALDDATHGHGAIVLLAGEAGIGKTAILSALEERAKRRSVAVAAGRCWEGAGAPAFWPWSQALRTLAAMGVDVTAARGVMPSDGSFAPDPSADGSATRFELFDGVARTVLQATVGKGGLLVTLDDLQWADDASLALLDFLGVHLAAAPVAIVGTYRDDEAVQALERLAGTASVIPLAGLDQRASAAVITSVAGRQLEPAVVTDLTRLSGGNPLFLRELTRLVASRPSGALSLDAATRLANLREVVSKRLSRLSDGCRTMLDHAAVLGEDVAGEVLVRTLGVRAGVAIALSEAVRARVLHPPNDAFGDYRFAHGLFREVILRALPPEERAMLHLRAARTLEEMRSQGAAVPMATLAAHYVAAVSSDPRASVADAVRCSRAAAAESTRQTAYEDAAQHLRRALAALTLGDAHSPHARLELLLELGVALDRAGEAAGARGAFIDAAELARRERSVEVFAEAALGIHRLGALSGMARFDTIRLLEEAGRDLGADSSALRSRVFGALARELHHSWEPTNIERARKYAEDAVSYATRAEDPFTLAFSLLAQHDTEWMPGTAARRLTILGEMRELARLVGDDELVAQAQLLTATALLELGDPSAPSELDAYCRIAEALGHSRGRWGAISRRATAALIAGRLERATALARAALHLGQQIGEPDTAGVWDTQRWELARFLGGRAEIEPGEHWVPSGSWPPHRGLLLSARGDLDGARAAMEGYSIANDRDHGTVRHDGWTFAVIADAATLVGTRDLRLEAYEWLLPLSGTHLVFGACMGYGGAADHHLGQLALSLGRHADGRRHLEESLRMHQTLGATAWASLDRSLLTSQLDPTTRPAAGAVQPTVDDSRGHALRCEGDTWAITFHGRTTRVRHVKGLSDLAQLLRQPHRELSAIDLMGGSDVGAGPGPALDETARLEYRARISELQREVDDARTANDWFRAERAESELDALVTQLANAFGLSGRERAGGSSAERARAAVTHRIRAAIKRIAHVEPDVGRHLENSIRTGTWCVYSPERDMEWVVEV